MSTNKKVAFHKLRMLPERFDAYKSKLRDTYKPTSGAQGQNARVKVKGYNSQAKAAIQASNDDAADSVEVPWSKSDSMVSLRVHAHLKALTGIHCRSGSCNASRTNCVYPSITGYVGFLSSMYDLFSWLTVSQVLAAKEVVFEPSLLIADHELFQTDIVGMSRHKFVV